MKYKIYKFEFQTAVHIGNGQLTDAEHIIMADTIFSALCHEALNTGGVDMLNRFVSLAKDRKIQISDGFPYLNNDSLYIPKPVLIMDLERKGDSKEKKLFKKLKYIPVDKLDDYLKGTINPKEETDELKALGVFTVKEQAAVRGLEESMPYSVGSYQFNKDNGIYICVGYEDGCNELLEDLLKDLSYSGIGGKRSAGFGKFNLRFMSVPSSMEKRLTLEASSKWMTISVSLPREEEMEDVLTEGYYGVIKRSGFVSSETFSDTHQKKKDLYMIQSGSCFSRKYEGDIYDVSFEGNHPVYRYGIPMFMGVGTYE